MKVFVTVYLALLMLAACLIHGQFLQGCSALRLFRKKNKDSKSPDETSKRNDQKHEKKSNRSNKSSNELEYDPEPNTPEGKRIAMLKKSGLLD